MTTAKFIPTFVLIVATFANVAWAAPASPAATPADDKTRQIEELKERLATKVAQLRSLQRQAIAGVIKSTSISTLVVETKTKDVKIELTDDIRVFQYLKGVRTKLTVDDLEKGDNVVVFGEYDATLDLLKAKIVFIQAAAPARVAGTAADIDRTEFTLTLNTAEGQTYTIDIEKTTKTFQWKGGQIEKSGFSKVTLGDTVFVLGAPVAKQDNRLSAIRILDLGNLTAATPSPTLSPESSPSATP